ncbi:MAG: hypothetical protein LBQ52_04695 [Helicobacteraceae bacterium]|jgi:hypothetical protein|nr:hypothetical protein [Helicobacteraceae bacterium]
MNICNLLSETELLARVESALNTAAIDAKIAVFERGISKDAPAYETIKIGVLVASESVAIAYKSVYQELLVTREIETLTTKAMIENDRISSEWIIIAANAVI